MRRPACRCRCGRLVKLVAARLGATKGNSIYLLSLFPGNPAKLAAKIAGLPRPTNCL